MGRGIKLLTVPSSGSRCTHLINYNQRRTSFYNKYRHGPSALTNPKPDYWKWMKEFFSGGGKQFVKEEWERVKAKAVERRFPTPMQINQTKIFEHFDTDEAISKWKVWADSDALAGFSKCVLSRSPAGHAHFKGILDTRVPDDGVSQLSGFVCLMGPRRPRHKFMQLETCWNWEKYNVFEMKVRGDGRKYNLVLHTGTRHDNIKFYDMFGIPFYTRGGPQWQTITIPFSKFIFTYKGLIQDEQGKLPDKDIKFVAITLQDNITGPFSLEVDYMALRSEYLPFDEVTAYENYAFPHIKYRQLQVDSPHPNE